MTGKAEPLRVAIQGDIGETFRKARTGNVDLHLTRTLLDDDAAPVLAEAHGWISKRFAIEMVGIDEFDWMNPDSYLINIARGRIVDEAALYEALRIGSIAGTAIDVWYHHPVEDEQLSPFNPANPRAWQRNHDAACRWMDRWHIRTSVGSGQ